AVNGAGPGPAGSVCVAGAAGAPEEEEQQGGAPGVSRPDRGLALHGRAARHARGEAEGILAGGGEVALAGQGGRRLAGGQLREEQGLRPRRAALPGGQGRLPVQGRDAREGNARLRGEAGEEEVDPGPGRQGEEDTPDRLHSVALQPAPVPV